MAAVAEAQDVATRSVAMMFQSGVEEAAKTLNEFPCKTASLDCAMCFVKSVQCLLTFDFDVMDRADAFIKDVEHRCSASIKSAHSDEDSMMLRIITADCELLRALLAFARQTLANYVRGGMHLRSASKTYTSIITELKKRSASNKRVEAACSMGFGAVNVAVSLLPEKVMGLLKLVGFRGNRRQGLESLEVAARSSDMRAPFSMLLLLAYNVVTRPVLGIDVSDGMNSAIQAGTGILELSKSVCPDAALFTYFYGRVEFLKKDVDKALEFFSEAATACSHQPEMHQLCQYEIAYIKIVSLKWSEASDIFLSLCRSSPWSPAMYAFFSSITLAATGAYDESNAKLESVPELMKAKSTALEKLVRHKVSTFTAKRLTEQSARVELLAMAYMSNYINWCGPELCEDIVDYLDEHEKDISSDVYFYSCSSLVRGAALIQLEEADRAEVHLRNVLTHAQTCVQTTDSHVPAHATLLLANVYKMRGETDKARNALEKTKSLYTDYELESQVQTKVKACLEALS
eukprot:scpid46246/ scgid28529/ Tetratricopeptide repeat protein 39C